MQVINAGDVETVALADLRPHPRNPRQGDVGAIHQSIERNGFYGAVVAQRSTGHVLAGNHRMIAAEQAGADALPVIWLDVDDEAALRILLADNRTNDLASYDTQALADLLTDILQDTGSLDGTGYDGDALDELLADLGGFPEADDAGADMSRAEGLRETWGVERGQVWAIPTPAEVRDGRVHRLMCGDSTDEADVGRLLDGAEPRLMVTDPPYGVEYDPGWRHDAAAKGMIKFSAKRAGKVENDDRADWSEAWEVFSGAVVYCWHAGRYASLVQRSLETAGFEVRSQIVWAKDSFSISRGHYHWQHEPCWYAVRKGDSAEWIGDRSQSTVWEINKNDGNDQGTHGTQKPIECMARPIRNHKGDVYDPFVGSGTTLVAAEQEHRTCYAMDIDPVYVAVALQRMADTFGCEPRLLEAKQEAA